MLSSLSEIAQIEERDTQDSDDVQIDADALCKSLGIEGEESIDENTLLGKLGARIDSLLDEGCNHQLRVGTWFSAVGPLSMLGIKTLPGKASKEL